MECRLVQAIPLGGEGPGSDLFIGEVVRFHVDEAIYEDGRIDPRGLNAVSRLAGAIMRKLVIFFLLKDRISNKNSLGLTSFERRE